MRILLVLGVLALTHAVSAQPESALPRDRAVQEALRTLDAEGTEDDPLGSGDVATLRDVQVRTPRDAAPEILRVPAEVGDELVAIPGVRETARRVDVRFVEGLVTVREEITLTSRATHVAEARLRLPRPDGAWLVALELCEGERCVAARPDGSTGYDAALVHAAFGAEETAGLPAARRHERGSSSANATRATSATSTSATSTSATSASATSTSASSTSATSTSASATSPAGPSVFLAGDAHVDARGPAFSVHVAPIRPGASPTLRVRWAAPLVTRSGVAQLRIPARGNDLRAVVAHVSFDAGELLGPTLQGGSNASAVEVEPWSTIELAARLPSHAVRTHAHLFPCGARRCVHAALETGPRTGPAEHVALLVDVSPSTFGPARGRIAPVLTALLAALPPRSDVRAFAFAAQAEALLDTPTPPTEVPFAALASSTQRSLGGATRLDVALNALGDLRDTHVLVLGDGGLTEGPHLRGALAAAERRGARLSVISLTGRTPHPLLAEAVARLGGRVALLGDDAFVAHGDLDGRVASLFAPSLGRASVGGVALGELRAGESLRHVGLAGRRESVRLGRLSVAARTPRDAELVDALAALGRQHAGGPTRLALAPTADAACDALVGAGADEASRTTPWMLADVRSCALPTAPPPTPDDLGRGIPAETVLSMLRRRVVPVARGCFRRDRAGRENYATRAVFELRLADREVTSADVIGEIDDELRECLLTSVDGLDVPAYAGTIVVRYPLYTQASGPALTIELHPDVAQVVDRVLPEETP
ncbi:MAG: hypothetical protein H6720_04960 [Sandaracinus sp.]|nr:hypothetical protein [Sandaracinus sp.]